MLSSGGRLFESIHSITNKFPLLMLTVLDTNRTPVILRPLSGNNSEIRLRFYIYIMNQSSVANPDLILLYLIPANMKNKAIPNNLLFPMLKPNPWYSWFK